MSWHAVFSAEARTRHTLPATDDVTTTRRRRKSTIGASSARPCEGWEGDSHSVNQICHSAFYGYIIYHSSTCAAWTVEILHANISILLCLGIILYVNGTKERHWKGYERWNEEFCWSSISSCLAKRRPHNIAHVIGARDITRLTAAYTITRRRARSTRLARLSRPSYAGWMEGDEITYR